ncbi:MAG: hypothetical protein IJQ81_09705 [Oscillibacter sp.]|nr:hypothetical protein [Oscillibacter sp.]
MATVAQLNRRIRELETELQRLNGRQDSVRQRMEREARERIQGIRQEMAQSLNRLDVRNRERVEALRGELSREMRRSLEEIRRRDAQTQRERQELLRKLSDVNEELRRELDDMRRQEVRRNQLGGAMAKEAEEKARARASRVALLPHEFFCPGQLDVFREHLRFARTMMERRMFDAATAVADAALSELEILEINVREAQREWEELYHVYSSIIQELYDRLSQFQEERLRTVCGSFSLKEADWEYWSGGEFRKVRDDILNAHKLIGDIEHCGGVTAYLNSGQAVREFQFSRQITSLYRMEERLQAVTQAIREERSLSDERFQMGRTVAESLRAVGYQIVSCRFRGQPTEEPLESYDVTATANNLDRVTITFCPVRQHGVAVRNVCLIRTDLQSVSNAWIARKQAKEIQDILAGQFPDLRTDICPMEMDSAVLEERYKRPPDIPALYKEMERRYR